MKRGILKHKKKCVLTGLALLGTGAARSAPHTTALVAEHLRSAALSFDERSAAPLFFEDLRSAAPSFDDLSASDNASTFPEPAFQEPAFREPAANKATSNDATPPDAPGSGSRGILSRGYHFVAASVTASMAVDTFAPTVYPVVRSTVCNAASYFASKFSRTRRWDAAIAPIIAATTALPTATAGTADGEINMQEFPEWLRVAAHEVLGSQV